MKKIVINSCYGGYGLSYKAVMEYAKLKGIKLYPFIDNVSKEVYGKNVKKDNPNIIVHYATKKATNETELNDNYFDVYKIERDNPILIKVIEKLGEKANGRHAKLKIVKIPDNTKWTIEEYDGIEWVSEEHNTWS